VFLGEHWWCGVFEGRNLVRLCLARGGVFFYAVDT